MQRVYVAFLSETLTEHFIDTVNPPPRRAERYADAGYPLETAIDVYIDTEVRSLGLWVSDTGFKSYAVRPRRLPAGVSDAERQYIAQHGVDIGPPRWVSRSQQHV